MTYFSARAALTAPILLLLASACSPVIVSGGTGASSSSSSGTTTSGHGSTGPGTTQAVTVGTGGGTVVAASGGAGGAGDFGGAGGTGGAGTTVATGAGGAPMCTAAEQAAIQAKMIQAPIKPGQAGLLDLAGPNKMGLTLTEAEQILCQGMDLGDQFGDGSALYTWDPNQDFTLDVTPASGAANFMNVWGPGYAGQLQMSSRDGTSVFQVGVNGNQITKNGQPYQLDWNLAGGLQSPQFIAEENELHDALVATYFPGTPADPACQTTGTCVSGTFGDVGYLFFKDTGISLWVASVSASQPVPSIPNRIDVYPPQ